jgi:hypothetical protein
VCNELPKTRGSLFFICFFMKTEINLSNKSEYKISPMRERETKQRKKLLLLYRNCVFVSSKDPCEE